MSVDRENRRLLRERSAECWQRELLSNDWEQLSNITLCRANLIWNTKLKHFLNVSKLCQLYELWYSERHKFWTPCTEVNALSLRGSNFCFIFKCLFVMSEQGQIHGRIHGRFLVNSGAACVYMCVSVCVSMCVCVCVCVWLSLVSAAPLTR